MYPDLILASGSPRRRQLLGGAGVTIDVRPSDIPERPLPGESPRDYVRRMAAEKCGAVVRTRDEDDERPVLGADTVVVLDGEVMEKPADRADARRMLGALSGDTHRVITGYHLYQDRGDGVADEVVTEVRFRELSEAEIEVYLHSNEWADKAGGYAIQGGAAGMVAAINGSYTNVVGLPLAEVLEALTRLGGQG